MKILKEFKDFAMRGNIIDMAIGVIIGSAFGKIVSSFVENRNRPVKPLHTAKLHTRINTCRSKSTGRSRNGNRTLLELRNRLLDYCILHILHTQTNKQIPTEKSSGKKAQMRILQRTDKRPSNTLPPLHRTTYKIKKLQNIHLLLNNTK